MTDSAPQEGTPFGEVTLGDDGSLVTVDLSGAPETAGGVVGRIIGGLVLMIVGAVIAVGSAVGVVAAVLNPATFEWSDLIADAAVFVIPLGAALAFIGFTLVRSGRKRKAANLEGLANFLGATGLADVEEVDLTPGTQRNPPPPKSII
jgi:hypothetical protein